MPHSCELRPLLFIGVLLFLDTASGLSNCGWELRRAVSDGSQKATVSASELTAFDGTYIGGGRKRCETTITYTGYMDQYLSVDVQLFDLKGPSSTGKVCNRSESVTFVVDGSEAFTWCGQLHAESHTFRAQKIKVIYNTGEPRNNGKGFSLIVKPVPQNGYKSNSRQGSQVLEATEQPKLLYSVFYPSQYPIYMNYTVTLTARYPDYHIHIRILWLDIEEDIYCYYDYLKVDAKGSEEKYCGTNVRRPRDIVIKRDKTVIYFFSDHAGISGGGYILQYAAYKYKSGAEEINNIEPDSKQLFTVQPGRNILFSPVGEQVLHLMFLGRNTTGSVTGGIDTDDKADFSYIPKHLWNMAGSKVGVLVYQTIEVLVESFADFQCQDSWADITIAFCHQGLTRIYHRAGPNIELSASRDIGSDSLAIHNGPDTMYYDLTKKVDGLPVDSERNKLQVRSYRTDVVTISPTDLLGQTGFWIAYNETDDEPYMQHMTGDKDVDLLALHQRNMFCRLVFVSRNSGMILRADVDLPDPYLFEVKSFSNGAQRVVLENPAEDAEVRFPSGTILIITAWVPDLRQDSTDDGIMRFQVLFPQGNTDDFDMNDVRLTASYSEESVKVPTYMIGNSRGPQRTWLIETSYQWSIETSYPWSRQFVEIRFAGYKFKTYNYRFSRDEPPSSYLSIKDGSGSGPTTYAIKPGSQSLVVLRLKPTVTIDLYRLKYQDLGDVLFNYSRKSDNNIPCNTTIEISPGKPLLLTQNKDDAYMYYSRSCWVMPKYYNSEMVVKAEVLNDVRVSIIGYEPANMKNTDLGMIRLREVPSVSLGKRYVFKHMAIQIDVKFVGYGFHNSEKLYAIKVDLQKEEACGNFQLHATDEAQYIASPNYPHPFSRPSFCQWLIKSDRPIHFEFVHLDLTPRWYKSNAGHCTIDYLKFTTVEDSVPMETKCGDQKGVPMIAVLGCSQCDIRVTFEAQEKNDESMIGFMLRYRQARDTELESPRSDSSDSSKSSKTQMAVGVGIASLLVVIMVAVVAALIVMRKRKKQEDRRRQRLRQRLREAHSEERCSSENQSGNSNVFIVGPMIFNTAAPPPPYPGPPSSAEGYINYGASDDNGGFYTNPDGGYIDRIGQHVATRGGQSVTPADPPSYSWSDDPPPYHPAMPGNPAAAADDHVYHGLSTVGDSEGNSTSQSGDSGVYTLADNTTPRVNGSDLNGRPESYSLANLPGNDNNNGHDPGYARPTVTDDAGYARATATSDPGYAQATATDVSQYDSLHRDEIEGASGYASLSHGEDPPPYDDIRDRPPPYDETTRSSEPQERTAVSGEPRGRSRLGPL